MAGSLRFPFAEVTELGYFLSGVTRMRARVPTLAGGRRVFGGLRRSSRLVTEVILGVAATAVFVSSDAVAADVALHARQENTLGVMFVEPPVAASAI